MPKHKIGDIITIKVKDRSAFEANIFGADSFLKSWPELLTTGIRVKLVEKYWYVINKDDHIINDTAFFSEIEMQDIEEVIQ